MAEEDSKKIIKYVLDNIPYNKIIITTPNFEFNKYYNMTGFRHSDHKWEYTGEQFISYIKDVVPDNIPKEFVGIGDTVDGISVTQAVIITK